MLTLVPWGALTDRIGERPVMATGLAGCAVALVGAALATSYRGAARRPARRRHVRLQRDRRVRAARSWGGSRAASAASPSGIRQMALPLGGALASLTLPTLIDAQRAGGGLRRPRRAVRHRRRSPSLVLMRDPPPAPDRRPALATPPPTRDVRLWRLGAGGALLVGAQASMLGFIVLFLHDARDVSAARAAAALGVLQIVGALVRIVAGRRSDREGLRIAPMRRIAARNTALLVAVGALATGAGVLLYPLLASRGHLDDELERPGLHRRRRDLGPRTARARR